MCHESDFYSIDPVIPYEDHVSLCVLLNQIVN